MEPVIFTAGYACRTKKYHAMKKCISSRILISIVLVTGSLLSSLTLTGQDVKSIDLKKIKNDNYLYVIGGQGNNVFAGITDNYYVQPDDKLPALYINLENEDEQDVTLKPASKSDILYAFYYQGNVYTLEYGNKPHNNGMYPINLVEWNKNLEPEKTVSDTARITPDVFRVDLASMFRNEYSPQSGKWRRSYIISHKVSPDGKNILITLNNTFQTKPPRTVYCLLYHPGSSSFDQYTITIPSKEQNLIVEDYVLTNNGKIYLLTAGFADNSFTKKPDTFHYSLYHYDPGNGTLKSMEMDAGDHFVTDLGLSTSADGTKPRLAGLYSDARSMNVSGIAYFRMESQETMKGYFTPMDENTLNMLNSGNNNSGHADEYDVRYIFPESNGDLTFFAEHYARKPGLGMNISLLGGVSPKAQLEDHYGNIVVARIKPDGKPAWSKVVEKNQKSTDENIMFNSFAVAKKGDRYGLLFNEEVKNMSDVDWVSLDSDGTMGKKKIFDRTKDRLRVAPMLASVDEDGHLYVPALRFNKTKLVEISF